jgi:hypothetical protein
VKVLNFKIPLFGVERFREGSAKETASNFVQISKKSVTETLEMIRQAFGEESMNRKCVFE